MNALAAIARRALDEKAAGRFFSVRELQMQVDAFKDSFDAPAQVTLKTIARQWLQRYPEAQIYREAGRPRGGLRSPEFFRVSERTPFLPLPQASSGPPRLPVLFG